MLPYYRTLNTSLSDNSTAVVALDLGKQGVGSQPRRALVSVP